MMKSFKKIVSEKRREKRLTLRKLGQLTGISASSLSEIENGVKLPPKAENKIKKLANTLGCEFKLLLKSAQTERAKGKIPNVLARLFGHDDELAWGLCREAENNEGNFEELREIFKDALKAWEASKK